MREQDCESTENEEKETFSVAFVAAESEEIDSTNSSDHDSEEHPQGSLCKQKCFFCCMGCVTLIGYRSRFVNSLAFYPPPANYKILENSQFVMKTKAGILKPLTEIFPTSQITIRFQYLSLSKNQRLASLFLAEKTTTLSTSPCFLFSHGNGSDMGVDIFNVYNLCRVFKCNAFIYDYCGYGASDGELSVSSVYASIRIAWKYLVTELRIPPRCIILYGYSIGSAPSCDLAARKAFPVGALILHGGIASGLHCLFPSMRHSPWYNVFRNIKKLRLIQNIPILIMHGKKDEQVPIQNSYLLQIAAGKSRVYSGGPSKLSEEELTKRKAEWKGPPVMITERLFTWWFAEANHHNVEILCRKEFFQTIAKFVQIWHEWQFSESKN